MYLGQVCKKWVFCILKHVYLHNHTVLNIVHFKTYFKCFFDLKYLPHREKIGLLCSNINQNIETWSFWIRYYVEVVYKIFKEHIYVLFDFYMYIQLLNKILDISTTSKLQLLATFLKQHKQMYIKQGKNRRIWKKREKNMHNS